MKSSAQFGSFKRVLTVTRRLAFSHRISGLDVDSLRSFRLCVMSGISTAISFFREAIAECGDWLLLVMLSSANAKGALRLLGDEWSGALSWLKTRLGQWMKDPVSSWAKLTYKRRRRRQKRWFQDLNRHFS